METPYLHTGSTATNSEASHHYDAIVIGSGISGGWAAKELTGKGLRTLVLERGRPVEHVTDYPTTMLNPWELPRRGQLSLADRQANPIVARTNYRQDNAHFFVKDSEHPYVQEQPFDWIRGYQVGGKSLIWARHTQRWSDFDFDGPARDGFATDWPIRYKDLAPWYSYVEKFAGISGNRDGLPELPDGEFLPPFELTAVEKHFRDEVARHYKDRHVIIARCAHVTDPQPVHTKQGRAKCQNRVLCHRGCPFGGYFSSNASTLPWAMQTGKLTLRPHAVVHSLIYDEARKRVTGVRVIDAQTQAATEYFARVFFVNASALNTNLILLNSTSGRFPNGLGNDSGLLGKYVAFHNYRARIDADYDGLLDYTTDGRRPTSAYIPRFRNVFQQETSGPASRFLRGYATGIGAFRAVNENQQGLGTDLKASLGNPQLGLWRINAHMMGETIPKESSRVSLDPTRRDAWGIPLLNVKMSYDDNDEQMIKDYHQQLSEMLDRAGFKNIKTRDTQQAPGLDIHEMGGVRMGRDAKTSLLNAHNQLHHCPNVFVTDGACMTSTATQNPSLTYMALTARAAHFAVNALKRKAL
jgi:choline dehydrogenase-like flavoprotein